MCRTRTAPSREHRAGDRSVRASDADRERTADVLREQAGVGRLEPDELEERLERAFGARALADLDALTADLPRRDLRQERSRSRRSATPFPALLVAVVITLAIVVHPLVWLALIPVMCMKHTGPRAPAAWRGSPS